MKKLSTVLSENLANSQFSFVDIQSFDELIKKANSAVDEKPIKPAILNQQHVKSFTDDEMLAKYFRLSDILEAFLYVANYYFEHRKDFKLSYIDEKLIKILKSIKFSIDQLASYISPNHTSTKVEITLPPETFDNKKSLSTFIKQSDDWKEMKEIMKSDLILSHQTLTVRCLAVSIIDKTKKFIKIIN